jgi:hypothetical protein
MEKVPKYIFFILLLLGYLNIQAQDASVQPTNPTDPKLAAEQANSGPATSINPAKPVTPLSDPKLNMEIYGSTVAKPSADLQKDPKLEAEATSSSPKEVIPVVRTESKVSATNGKTSNEQPAGIAPKTSVNYRKIQGPDTQPAAVQLVKANDFRKINGPNTQPAGEKPKR